MFPQQTRISLPIFLKGWKDWKRKLETTICYKGNKQKSLRNQITEGLVPQTGLEPVRPCGHRILSPACLPVPPPGHGVGKKKDPNRGSNLLNDS